GGGGGGGGGAGVLWGWGGGGNSSPGASRTAGPPRGGRAPLGIGAVMAPMPASAGAAPTAGTAGSCRDTTAPRGSHRHTASGPSPEHAAVPASAGPQPLSEPRGMAGGRRRYDCPGGCLSSPANTAAGNCAA